MSVRDPRDVLLAPVISEKSYGLIDSGQYTFIVLPEANKTQIKIAVEQIFNVKVLGVNTINRQGKRKRSRGAQMGTEDVDEGGHRMLRIPVPEPRPRYWTRPIRIQPEVMGTLPKETGAAKDDPRERATRCPS